MNDEFYYFYGNLQLDISLDKQSCYLSPVWNIESIKNYTYLSH